MQPSSRLRPQMIALDELLELGLDLRPHCPAGIRHENGREAHFQVRIARERRSVVPVVPRRRLHLSVVPYGGRKRSTRFMLGQVCFLRAADSCPVAADILPSLRLCVLLVTQGCLNSSLECIMSLGLSMVRHWVSLQRQNLQDAHQVTVLLLFTVVYSSSRDY